MPSGSDETARESQVRAAGSKPRKARLHIMGPGRFETRPLPEEGELSIGRAPSSDILLEVEAVSRVHATLQIGETFRIHDTSANGTTVRGHRLQGDEWAPVLPGDPIEIGPFVLTIALVEASERAIKIWPPAYFDACVDAECERAVRQGTTIDLVRLRTKNAINPDALARALNADLRSDELASEREAGWFQILLIDRSEQVASSIVQTLASRLESLGASPSMVGRARFPRDARTAAELFARWNRTEPAEDSSARAGADTAMDRVLRLVDRVAAGSISVLIAGETGAGKEVTAEAIHQKSARARGPFVRLNCAAFSETLIESELFGHERGAFTGAVRSKLGLLETAQGGTLFLDEVGELPAPAQGKLLRVLEERRVLRVGGLKPIPIDVRLISATNRDLELEIERGRFRRDLFFRLNGITITVPPLRERLRELEAMADRFIAEACARDQLERRPVLSREALSLLRAHAWPGNIRELKNAIERAVLLSHGAEAILPDHLPPEISGLEEERPEAAALGTERLTDQVEAFERDRIVAALEATNGNQTEAAKRLGIARRTLINRLEAYGIDRPRKRRPGEDL